MKGPHTALHVYGLRTKPPTEHDGPGPGNQPGQAGDTAPRQALSVLDRDAKPGWPGRRGVSVKHWAQMLQSSILPSSTPCSHSPTPSPNPIQRPRRQHSKNPARTSLRHWHLGPDHYPVPDSTCLPLPRGLVCVERCNKPPPPFSPCTKCPPGGAQRPKGQTEGQTHRGYAPLRSPVLQCLLDSKELRRGGNPYSGGGGG